MLFSRDDVATFVSRYFEPAWQSVRPVPTVKIDFGDGNVVTRTLHGNIATYVCTPQGETLDILPGIYTPQAYVGQLNQFRLLANYVDQLGQERRPARLREYHEQKLAALKKNEMPPQFVNMADVSKLAIEGRVKAVLVAQPKGAEPAAPPGKDKPKLDSKEALANWDLLAKDTEVNEKVRRVQIHEMLAKDGPVPPEKVTKRVYKEVLHSDLDDPYLGLGKVLFDNYVFGKEERAH